MDIHTETLISFVALIISIISFISSLLLFKENKRILQYQVNIQKISENEVLLKQNPDLLKFHNIEISELIKDNITQDEFFYILGSLRASEAFYTVKNRKKKLSRYREVFLSNPKVRFVYLKYLRQNFFSQPTFRKLLDDFYCI